MKLTLALCALTLAAHTPADPTIAELAAGKQFSTLRAALEAADLTDALAAKDANLTVFAPTNAAFAKLGEHELQRLLQPENKSELQSILLYHVASSRLDAATISRRAGVTTLDGQRIDVDLEDGAVLLDGTQRLQSVDLAASNGIVHTIDAVLLPERQNVVELAAGEGTFNYLIAAAKAAGLADVLQGDGPFTVLAPTDAAFEALGEETINALLQPEAKEQLQRILLNHVIPGRVYADQAAGAATADTLARTSLSFRIEDGGLTAGGAKVLANDLEASNGVVHVIDRVLVPAAPRGRLMFGYQSERPSASLAAQLGVDADASVVITEVTRKGNGLQPFDLIVAVEGQPYSAELVAQVKERKGFGGAATMEIFRGGKRQKVKVSIGADPH